jgi:hypothetical protein
LCALEVVASGIDDIIVQTIIIINIITNSAAKDLHSQDLSPLLGHVHVELS